VPILFPPTGEEWQWKMASRKKARQQHAIYNKQEQRPKQQPRSYQTELADKAEQDNTIIFIPTGKL
jgi:ERCC4-related helicase